MPLGKQSVVEVTQLNEPGDRGIDVRLFVAAAPQLTAELKS
jgi:hypothetical protein